MTLYEIQQRAKDAAYVVSVCGHCEGREMVQDEQGNIWPCPQGCTPDNSENYCQSCVGARCTARPGCVALGVDTTDTIKE